MTLTPEQQRRSRVDWLAVTGDEFVARTQVSWERRNTVLAMYEAGFSWKEIAAQFGINVNQTLKMLFKAERERKMRSPVERWTDKAMPSAVWLLAKAGVENSSDPRDSERNEFAPSAL